MKATTKPVEVEYIQWTGDNEDDVTKFLETGQSAAMGYVVGPYVEVGSDSGLSIASIGDYIIKTSPLDYLVKKEIGFHSTYDIEPKESEWKNGDPVIYLDGRVHCWIGYNPDSGVMESWIKSACGHMNCVLTSDISTPPVTESE